ncbi:hypothetical protein RGQ13_00570 [Thalassotalea psychrophila]|uniref:Uncharacterized protein n=1 Tax=Thalassotalea psychrophila TaxID=3065647 RepID=A0ABY9TYG2_9GAMM|nr:hypothetical protein RGQ13_00570 [Colwelliaceae bacterium SQ149]
MNNFLEFTSSHYAPALQIQYTQSVVKVMLDKLPKGLNLQDLVLFNQSSNLIKLEVALYSAGLIGNLTNPKNCMVTQRLKIKSQADNAILIGDSSGFQEAKAPTPPKPKKIVDIFNWLITYCNLAMTLDVPLGAAREDKSPHYRTFRDCLGQTLANLDTFTNLGAQDYSFLNVVQGQSIEEINFWYQHVKKYKLYGWALPFKCFGLTGFIWFLLKLIEDGEFDKDNTWIHCLGVSDLSSAAMFNVIIGHLRRKVAPCKVNITFDSSSPFLAGGKLLSAYGAPVISSSKLSIPQIRVDKPKWCGSSELFPSQYTQISRYLTKGDIINRDWDNEAIASNLGYLLLQNHNTETALRAIGTVNNLLAVDSNQIPICLVKAKRAIEHIFSSETINQALVRLSCTDNVMSLESYK